MRPNPRVSALLRAMVINLRKVFYLIIAYRDKIGLWKIQVNEVCCKIVYYRRQSCDALAACDLVKCYSLKSNDCISDKGIPTEPWYSLNLFDAIRG